MAATIEAPLAPGRTITGRTIALLASIGVAAAVAAGGIGFVLGQQGDEAPATSGVAVTQDLSGMYSAANVQALKDAGFTGQLGITAPQGQALRGTYSVANVDALRQAWYVEHMGGTAPQDQTLSSMYSQANVQALKNAGYTGRLGAETELWPAPGR